MGGFSTEERLLYPRRFLFDFVWHEERVILEVHGGQWINGRHQTGYGFARDRVKMNLAQLEGWVVLEACTEHIKSGEYTRWVAKALGREKKRRGGRT